MEGKLAIVIKKRSAATAPAPIKEPEEKVAPRVAETPVKDWRSLPVASTLDELWANHGKMRPPEPTTCIRCGQNYPFPCHGENTGCMNAKFVENKKTA
jgi:hypothetical protein